MVGRKDKTCSCSHKTLPDNSNANAITLAGQDAPSRSTPKVLMSPTKMKPELDIATVAMKEFKAAITATLQHVSTPPFARGLSSSSALKMSAASISSVKRR